VLATALLAEAQGLSAVCPLSCFRKAILIFFQKPKVCHSSLFSFAAELNDDVAAFEYIVVMPITCPAI
jgi:hypothetical protein